MSKSEAAVKAQEVASAVTGGVQVTSKRVYHSTRFRRPKTKTIKTRESPRQSKLVPNGYSSTDEYRVLKYPLATEAALKQIEKNTLVFICDLKATKPQIKAAVYKRFQLRAVKVNTLIRPDGKKKAFIRLDKAHDASEFTSKLGLL